jgi:hypothetical protein
MFGLKEFNVELLTGYPAAVGLAAIALLVLAFFLYRRTNPPQPLYLRIILGLVRVIAVVALMAALAEPVITYTREYERPRRLALLIDRSASMDREEQGKTRSARLDSLLSSQAMERWRSEGAVTEYPFGASLAVAGAKIDREATGMGTALGELNRLELGKPSDYWLLLSDGNSNRGPQPTEVATSLRVPVTSVGLAAGGGQVDVGISDLDYNSVVYSGQPTQITIKLTWQATDNRTAAVQLTDSGQVLAEAAFEIDQADGFAEIPLRYVPGRPGQRLLQVRIPLGDDESNADNNSQTISVKTLKGRMAVLLVSSSPDYEVGFLKRFLDRSDRYDVDLVVLGRSAGNLAGRFPDRQTELNRYDLVILDDPDPNLLQSQQALLRPYLGERGGGLWIQYGSKLASVSSGLPVDLLPFYPSARTSPIYASRHAVPTEGQLFHPIVRLADSRAEIRAVWSDLPPFSMVIPCDQIADDAVVLAQVDGPVPDNASRLPALGYRRVGPGKVLASAVQPFWSWDFEAVAFAGETDAYEKFVDGAIRWLTVQDDFDPVRVLPQREVFNRGETVRFDGYAFDQGYRPIAGASGIVVLEHDGDRFETDLLDAGEGKFRAEFKNLAPGEYRYEGTISKDGRQLKQNRGTIVVESFSLEEFDQSGDPASLAALSQATGGRYVAYNEFDRALAGLDPSPVKISLTEEFSLWGNLWLLLIFVGALALEWVLRKLNQLL